MKIVVAGGTNAAEYIIRKFKESSNELVIINNNRNDYKKISNNT